MAVFSVSLAILLMLASQLDFSSAGVEVSGLRGKNLPGGALGNKPDPFLKISCGGNLYITSHIQGNPNPSWSSCSFPTCKPGHTLKVEVWDKDVKHHDLLGSSSRTVKSGYNKHSFTVGKGTMYFNYSAS